MDKSKRRFVIVPPEEAHLWPSAEECPCPLSELAPSVPMSPEDQEALMEQLKEMQITDQVREGGT